MKPVTFIYHILVFWFIVYTVLNECHYSSCFEFWKSNRKIIRAKNANLIRTIMKKLCFTIFAAKPEVISCLTYMETSKKQHFVTNTTAEPEPQHFSDTGAVTRYGSSHRDFKKRRCME
jgi:carbamate kinase